MGFSSLVPCDAGDKIQKYYPSSADIEHTFIEGNTFILSQVPLKARNKENI